MALKNYYELLEIPPQASTEDVKRSFRAQIARYHPDKVQHLGKEFQSLAADRAAELTEAYRILSDTGRRAEYDRAFAEAGAAISPAASSEPVTTEHQGGTADREPDRASTPPPPSPDAPRRGAQFKAERASSDEFVRKATLSRLRQALEAVGGGYEESQLRGFDLALVPKKKMFGSNTNPKLLARFVAELDREAVAAAWLQGLKWGDTKKDEVCVLLLGTALAPAGELAGEITAQRRKSHGAKVTLIPVDARVWDAHMPLDAPAIAKTLVARLRSGT
ncbi:MAG TPA: J domain-containing protein [Vicinamibacterales bacterium]|nr:J domain-containing protein [Vicinamibacterales bacterium]